MMATYLIRVQGHLSDSYSVWLDPLTIRREPSGETTLVGELVDQGALFGILLKIRDLGLSLLEVEEVKIVPDLEAHDMSQQTQQQVYGSAAGRYFDTHQRETIEAAMARIIPTDDQPGAREAGTIEFLDRYLSGLDYIYAKPDGSGFEKLEGKRAAAWQQRIEILREKYVRGITELNRRSQAQFSANFVQITTDQQDQILADTERSAQDAKAALEQTPATANSTSVEPALQQTSAEVQLDFFQLLVLHTRQGFYADPIYGGNKNQVGWRLIGFDGPDSLAETHAGRYTTLPYFATEQRTWGKEIQHGD